MQNFSNMNQPTWIRNHAQTIRTFKKKTCRQLNKIKAPVPDQQSSTSRSPDAHIIASLLLFMAAFDSALRGAGFRNSRGHVTCREARRKHHNQIPAIQKRGPTNKQTNKQKSSPRPGPPAVQNLCLELQQVPEHRRTAAESQISLEQGHPKIQKHTKTKGKQKEQKRQIKKTMQSADQVTAFDPESPAEFKALRQSALRRRHSDLRSAETRNPQKHGAQKKQ